MFFSWYCVFIFTQHCYFVRFSVSASITCVSKRGNVHSIWTNTRAHTYRLQTLKIPLEVWTVTSRKKNKKTKPIVDITAQMQFYFRDSTLRFYRLSIIFFFCFSFRLRWNVLSIQKHQHSIHFKPSFLMCIKLRSCVRVCALCKRYHRMFDEDAHFKSEQKRAPIKAINIDVLRSH